MSKPQTIQLFLPDGSPRSVKIAELTNRLVQAILIPRNKLDYISSRDEVKNVGCYFLFGEDVEKAKPRVYIGEAENCLVRLKEHDRKKQFWNYAVVFISQKNSFTKSHAKFLEHLAIQKAKEVNRFDASENTVSPARPHVTESMEADLLDSFETISILLSTLGYPVFDQTNKKEVFHLSGKGITAKGSIDNDGFVVLKGSQMAKKHVPSCNNSLVIMRERLVKEGIVKENGETYVFAEDYLFGSPSTAGGVLLGRNTNGWNAWKDKNGTTLDQIKRQ